MLFRSMSKITVLTNFLPVIYFNEYVFKAQANFWMSQHFLGEMNKTKIGIGQAIGYLSAACEALEKIKKDNVKLSQPMKVQYDTLVKTYEERKNCIKGLNDRMYHEAIPAELDRIECKLFTQAFSLDEWLNRPFEGIDILSGLVPSAVQDLEREYKEFIDAIIKKTSDDVAKADEEHEQFLNKHDLPASLYAASGEQKLPEDLLEKIQQCKEKGGIKLLRYDLENINSSADSIEIELNTIQSQMQCEIEEDDKFRRLYNPSPVQNKIQKLVKHIWEYFAIYKKKLDGARLIDEQISKILNENDEFRMIEIDKSEVIAAMPRSSCAERQLSFVASQ